MLGIYFLQSRCRVLLSSRNIRGFRIYSFGRSSSTPTKKGEPVIFLLGVSGWAGVAVATVIAVGVAFLLHKPMVPNYSLKRTAANRHGVD